MITGINLKILFSILLVLSFCFKARAIDITATGGWTESINSADLVSGAGSNLRNSYQSLMNATIINILNTLNANDRWRVDISRIDNTWYPGFILSARRTSNGTGNGNISGGTTYRQISTVNMQFFNGRGNRSNVNIRYRLTGMSISVAPNIYSTNVVYTLVDI